MSYKSPWIFLNLVIYSTSNSLEEFLSIFSFFFCSKESYIFLLLIFLFIQTYGTVSLVANGRESQANPTFNKRTTARGRKKTTSILTRTVWTIVAQFSLMKSYEPIVEGFSSLLRYQRGFCIQPKGYRRNSIRNILVKAPYGYQK